MDSIFDDGDRAEIILAAQAHQRVPVAAAMRMFAEFVLRQEMFEGADGGYLGHLASPLPSMHRVIKQDVRCGHAGGPKVVEVNLVPL
jgi:hypothetical protein